jgi:hypothetical protein
MTIGFTSKNGYNAFGMPDFRFLFANIYGEASRHRLRYESEKRISFFG